jgi:hypothetical protein
MTGPQLVMAILATAAPATSTPARNRCGDLHAYDDKWLVVVGASRTEAEAQQLAAKGGYCVLPPDSFGGLKPGLYVVVAAAGVDRRSGQRELQRVRTRNKEAYLKPAGRMCPQAPVAPETLAQVTGVDSALHFGWGLRRDLESRSQFWDFEADLEGGSPLRAYAMFHQGGLIRDEFFLFDHGRLTAAEVKRAWDADDQKKVPPPLGRRYYLAGDRCLVKTGTGQTDAYACLQACDKGIREKISARAGQVLTAVRTKGPALDKLVDEMSQSWVEGGVDLEGN